MIRHSAQLLVLLTAVLGPAGAARPGGDEAPPVPDGSHLLKVEVTAAKEFRRTEPVVVRIKVTNLTGDTVVYSHLRRIHTLFRIDVADEFGQVIPDTRFALYGGAGTGITEALLKGKTREYEVMLDAVKDLSEPGLYTVKVGMGFRANSEQRKVFRVTAPPLTLRILEKPKDPLGESDEPNEVEKGED